MADSWDKLPKDRYRVMREKGTELPFTGKLLYEKRTGMYVCGACGQELFRSQDKFDSGTGWPSFTKSADGAVDEKLDSSLFMKRIEAVCSRCGSHLGHVFEDGPKPTGRRFCINSISLDFREGE
jgi:peptide-methionine (R)-S-oxide reductase